MPNWARHGAKPKGDELDNLLNSCLFRLGMQPGLTFKGVGPGSSPDLCSLRLDS